MTRRVLAVPPQAVLPVAALAGWWGRLGGRSSLSPEWLNNFLEDRPLDIGTSRRDLGYEPRSLAEGVAQTLAWLRNQEGGDRCVTGAVRTLRQAGA